MGKDNTKSSGSDSRKSKKPRNDKTERPSHSGMSSIERYVADSQAYEQFTIGQPSNRDAPQQYVQNWEKTWKAASERKN